MGGMWVVDPTRVCPKENELYIYIHTVPAMIYIYIYIYIINWDRYTLPAMYPAKKKQGDQRHMSWKTMWANYEVLLLDILRSCILKNGAVAWGWGLTWIHHDAPDSASTNPSQTTNV